jgi:hypothetical protein
MPAAFDPYHRWLGIPPKDQPPNHYRLLGLELFENDPAVIESAADRQMVHVRTFQSGKYSVLSQRILNEIATAKVTLLNPEKKAAYDNFLRAKLAAASAKSLVGENASIGEYGQTVGQSAVAGTAVPESAVLGSAVPGSAGLGTSPASIAQAVPVEPIAGYTAQDALSPEAAATYADEALQSPTQPIGIPVTSSRRIAYRGRSRTSGTMVAVSVLAGATAIAAILYVAAISGTRNASQVPEYSNGPPSVAKANGKQDGEVAAQKAKGVAVKPNSQTADNSPASAQQPEQGSSDKPASQTSDPPSLEPAEPSSPQGQMGEPGPTTQQPGQPSETTQATEPSAKAAEPAGEGEASGSATQPPRSSAGGEVLPGEKSATPGGDKAAKALEELKATFAKEYAKANTAEGKLSLAKLLLVEAEQTTGDPTVQHVMLRQAAQLAAEAGDYLVCREAVLKLESRFSGDPWPLRIETLSELSRSVRTAEDRAAVVTAALQLVEAALRADNYDAADKLASIAVSAASKGSDLSLRKLAIEQREAVRVAIKAWEEVQPAVEKLASDPSDPEANLIVGRYRAFVRRDWAAGLPLLAKGSEARLKTIALADLANPSSPEEQAKLADLWWEYGETQSGGAQAAARARATHWYVLAEPHLQGLAKTRAERRLREAGAVVDLLAIFQPKKAAYVGSWQYDGRVLVSPPEAFARVQFPYTPPEAYEVSIVVERVSNPRLLGLRPPSVFAIGLPHAAGQLLALIDVPASEPSAPPPAPKAPPGRGPGRGRGEDVLRDFARNFFQQRASGLASPSDDGLTLVTRNEHPRALDSNRENTIVATVRPSGVTVSVNGASLISYSGDLKKLGVPRQWAMPDPKRIFIGSHSGIFRILKVEVRPLPP